MLHYVYRYVTQTSHRISVIVNICLVYSSSAFSFQSLATVGTVMHSVLLPLCREFNLVTPREW